MPGIRPLGSLDAYLFAAAPAVAAPQPQAPVDAVQLTADLSSKGVTFRRHRSFLWWHWHTDVSAEKAAKLAKKGKPGRLEASWKGCDPVPVSTVADLQTLNAFYGTRVATSLAHPLLGSVLLDLEARSTVFKGTVRGEDRDVGAYGAYTVLTGNPQGIEDLRADGVHLQDPEDLLFTAYLSNRTPASSLSRPAAAESIKLVADAKCTLSTGQPLETYRNLGSTPTIRVTLKDHTLLTATPADLDDPAAFGARLKTATAELGTLQATAGDATKDLWPIMRDDASPRPFAERLALMKGLLEAGLEHPGALYKAALACTPPPGDLGDAVRDAASVAKAVARHAPEDVVTAFELLRSTAPAQRPALLARLPAVAEALGALKDLQAEPTDALRLLAGLDAPALAAVKDLAQAARPWRSDGKWTRADVDGRPGWDDSPGSPYPNRADMSVATGVLSLRGLSEARLTFTAGWELEEEWDHFTVEGREPGGAWESLMRVSGRGGDRRHTLDLRRFEGRNLELRFRMTSDASGQREGVRFSDVRLSAKDGSGKSVEGPIERHIAGSTADTITSLLASASSPAAVSRALPTLQDLTARLGSARDAALVWDALAPRMADPDLPQRAAAAVRLAQAYGPEEGVQLLAHLEGCGGGTIKERTDLLETAQKLVDTTAVDDRVTAGRALYDRLSKAGADAQLRAWLERIAMQAPPWTAEAPWGRVRRDDGVSAWEDSPGRPYGNGVSAALTSAEVSLDGLRGVRLQFDEKHELESGYDYAHLEISQDGRLWERLLRLEGDGARSHSLDLSQYDGRRVRVRFRMQTDSSGTREGLQVARLRLTGMDSGGRKIDVPLEGRIVGPFVDHAVAIATDVGNAHRAADLEALSRLVEESRSTAVASETWPLLAPHTTGPDAVARRQALSRLAKMGEAAAVRRAWRHMDGFSQPEMAQALKAIDTIAASVGSTGAALEVWNDVAPHFKEAGFQDLVAARSHLAGELGVDAMRQVWPEISVGTHGTAHERSLLFGASRELAGLVSLSPGIDATMGIYRRLLASRLDPAVRTRVEKLGARANPWKAAGSWGAVAGGWSDSPKGNYANGRNDAVSATVPLDGLRGTHLVFEARHDLEDSYDFVNVEVTEDGSDWKRLARFNGRSGSKTHRLDMSAFDGSTATIRFRMESDASGQRDGFEATNIRLEARDASGRAVSTSVEQRAGEPVLSTVLDAVADPTLATERLDLLEKLEKDMGAAVLAGRLLPALLPHVGKADLDARRADLVKLAKSGGLGGALAAWRLLDAMPPARRAIELTTLGTAAADLHGDWSRALSLWSEEAAADVHAPGFTDRVRARAALTGALGEGEASSVWAQLSKGADIHDEVERWLTARDLARVRHGRASEADVHAVVAELRNAGMDAAAGRGVRRLLSGESTWEPGGTWARAQDSTGAWVWTDSPGKLYAHNLDMALKAPVLDLAGRRGTRLSYEVGYALEEGYDHLYLEASVDGGKWVQLDRITGTSKKVTREVDLRAYDGKRLSLRFRLKTDASGSREGVALCGVRLRTTNAAGVKQEHDIESLSAVGVADSLLRLATDPSSDAASRGMAMEFLGSLPHDQAHRVLSTLDRARADGLLEQAGMTPTEFLVRLATTLTVSDDLEAALQRALQGTKAGKVEVGDGTVVIGGVKVPVRS